MKSSEFFKKVFSWTLWANLFAMALVVVAACFGVKYGIDLYTHHGERIQVPNVRHKSFADAEHILDKLGLKIEVSDTGYVKVLPPDCILEQSILPGTSVKSGRIVYVVINAANTPTLTIPDVIDNSSYREARAKLEAMGFKVGGPQYVPGEKDWVYGIKCRGKLVASGQKVPVDAMLIIQVGDGMRDLSDSVAYIEPEYDDFDDMMEVDEAPVEEEKPAEQPAEQPTDQPAATGEVDEFEVVTGPE